MKNDNKIDLDEFFSNFFDVDKKELKNIKLGKSLEWDSMKHVDLIINLEKRFDIKVKPDQISKIQSFSDIIKIINDK